VIHTKKEQDKSRLLNVYHRNTWWKIIVKKTAVMSAKIPSNLNTLMKFTYNLYTISTYEYTQRNNYEMLRMHINLSAYPTYEPSLNSDLFLFLKYCRSKVLFHTAMTQIISLIWHCKNS